MIVEALYLDLEDLEQQSESGKEKKKKKNSVTWQDLKKKGLCSMLSSLTITELNNVKGKAASSWRTITTRHCGTDNDRYPARAQDQRRQEFPGAVQQSDVWHRHRGNGRQPRHPQDQAAWQEEHRRMRDDL